MYNSGFSHAKDIAMVIAEKTEELNGVKVERVRSKKGGDDMDALSFMYSKMRF